eukprot:scaffold5229_cov137-Skeletonema_menzelii.AAC.3
MAGSAAMVRNYKQHIARKARREARAYSQPIDSMFARQQQQQQQQQPPPAAAAEENEVEEEEEFMDAINDDANAAGGDGDGGGNNGNNEVGEEEEEEDGGGDDGDDEGTWPPFVREWESKVKDEIDRSVNMTGRGNQRRPMGTFPDKYKGHVSPSNDPYSFFYGENITKEHFALPDLLVWFPEGQYPDFCPHGRPPCKWHNEYECCVSKGWMPVGRRAYAMGRVILVLGRKYECNLRKDEGKECRFRNIDIEVINKSHDYIRLQWMKIGFDFSHRAGISNRDLQLSRRCLVQGLSVSGFKHVMEQAAKQRHLIISGQYRAWTETLNPNLARSPEEVRQMRRQPFYEFESAEYNQTDASTSYLLSRLVLLMESSNEYKERRMQMMDGVHLSGDHSFKIVRVCVSRDKPFTAAYCLLNEFSQVVAWWLTTGTGMDELEEPLQKLSERYNIHGFDRPRSFTTDRCCQERGFWNGVFGSMNDDAAAENAHLLPGDTDEIEVVQPPHSARCAYKEDVAGVLVGEIASYLANEPSERQVIAVDGEWRIGSSKMDLLIIGLLSGQVYLFHLAEICRNGAQFPLALKSLLEDPNVGKVGNRIHHDVSKLKSWGVKLASDIELGHVAFDRCVSPTRAPSVPFLVDRLYPGVTVEGKDVSAGASVRTSNWHKAPLTPEQLHYANCDGYVHALLYLRLMQFMNPRVEGKINRCDVVDGMKVVLYLPGFKNRVAMGVIRGMQNNKKVAVEIDLAQAECKSAIVHTVNDDGSTEEEGKSIHSLCSNLGEGESSIIKICWELLYCRRSRVGEDAPIEINTRTKQVVIDDNDGEDEEVRAQNYDGDDEANNGSVSSSSSDGENDNRTSLSRNLRRRLHQLRKERVKNDIEHIFLRFQRVLSKEHGAYYSFITSLRDAMFVLNDDDLEECLEVLREKRGKSDEEIAKMMAHDFGWFLRRVRRLVPSPRDLEKRYMEVYDAHKDIICQKSGKKLFGTKEAIAQHRSTLKHIRRNCISDIPFVTYYTPLKRDKDGLMRWRCHRGTSQNEGLHQKLRQLIRGFSNSPRFLCAVIAEYLLQWNQDIDVRVRGLPSKYYGLYDGVLLEDEIEKLAKNLDEPPHPEWIPTSSVQSTGETFGIIHTQTDIADYESDDAALIMLAEEAAGELSDDEADGGIDHHVAQMPKMPASSQWLATLNGRLRPFERVRGHDEWAYFEEHFLDYHGNGGGADNHSSINWSAFANDWNQMVDGLGQTKPSMTYKSASHLQQAYKSMVKRRRQQATLRSHNETLRELNEQHTNAATRAQFLPQFAPPVQATTAQPFVDAVMNIEEAPVEQPLTYDDDMEDVPTASKPKKKRVHRCRKCGRPYADKAWKHLHVLPAAAGAGNLRNQNGVVTKVWEYCRVPPEQYDTGFPCLEGRMPQPKKRR